MITHVVLLYISNVQFNHSQIIYFLAMIWFGLCRSWADVALSEYLFPFVWSKNPTFGA